MKTQLVPRFVLALLMSLPLTPQARAGTAPFLPLPWEVLGNPGEGIGGSVAPAGDVNGDGFGDILVSTRIDVDEEGGARLHLGTAAGSSTTPAWFYRSGQDGAGGGHVVASAGDVNGDGYFDVLVAVPGWDTPLHESAGKVVVFHGGPAGLPLAPTYERFSPIPAPEQRFGMSAATAGDVNGDGFADVVVGALVSDGTFTARGGAFVFHGSPSGLAAGPARTWLGPPNQDAGFGFTVSSAGDVNADGFADVLVGAPAADLPFNRCGLAFLYFGSAAGALALPDTIIAGAEDDLMGLGLSLAGDVNGDGYGDVLLGLPGANDNDGAAHVAFGGPAGLVIARFLPNPSSSSRNFGVLVATLGDLEGDGFADFGVHANFDSTGQVSVYRGGRTNVVHVGDAETTPRGFGVGSSFATTGDADGDGRSEILIGAPGLFAGSGNEAGVALQLAAPRELPRLAPGAPIAGPQLGSRFGAALAVVPHFEPTGPARLLIGAPNFDGFGRITMHEGSNVNGISPSGTLTWSTTVNSQGYGARLVDAGDMNGDGLSDFASSSPTIGNGSMIQAGRVDVHLGDFKHGAILAVAAGLHTFDRVGSALAGRGDVNGDGYQDLLVGAREWDEPGFTDCGKAFVVFGGPGALPLPWTVTGTAFGQGLGAGVALTDLDADGYTDVVLGSTSPNGVPGSGRVQVHYGGPSGPASSPGLVLDPPTPSESFGFVVAAIGDVNADGVADLAVGAPTESNVGVVRLYAGSLGRSQNPIPMVTLRGTQPTALFGAAIAGGGDVDGDGMGDFAVGQPFWDGGKPDEGRVLLHFGAPFVPEVTPGFVIESDSLGAQFGAAIAPFNDINGDLLADLIVGAPARDLVYPYLGVGLGAPAGLQLVEPAQGGEFRFHPARVTGPSQLDARFPVHAAAGGRTRARFEFEVVTQNELFTKTPTSSSGAVTFPTSPPGMPPAVVNANVALPQALPGRGLKVRGRWVTPSPFFRNSRWFAPEAHTSGDHDVWLTGNDVVGIRAPSGGPDALRIHAVAPNPSAGPGRASRIDFNLPATDVATLDVFDVRGALVRRLLGKARVAAGSTSASWDGKDDAGRFVPAGVYFVVLRAGPEVARAKLVRLP